MPVQALKRFLDDNQVRYVVITHSPAYTAQETAQSAHIPGRVLAKTVIVRLDDHLAMVVLEGPDRVDLNLLKGASGADRARLATEEEFRERFPGCETGAMPPFGNLYDMEVFLDESLIEDDEIAFNAGTHRELIRLAYADFEHLVEPKVARLSTRYA
jgi:Ala-tRNA(Pro) deacylase